MSFPRIPLAAGTAINPEVLAESTDPEHALRYIDIGSVGRGTLLDEPIELQFGDAPSRARRVVREGDTIVSSVRTYLCAVLPITDELNGFVVSTGFVAVRPTAFDQRFLAWTLQSDPFVEEVVSRSVGVSYPAIAPSAMARIRVPQPDPETQALIADFLDRETERIDALVEKKRRLIELLDEERTALITHAVTKGLDPTVPMKDSGISWIGAIPAHWEVGELRRWWTVTDCKHRTAEYVDEGIPIVGTPDIRHGRLDLSRARQTTQEECLGLWEGGRRPERGDLIYSRNASLGQAAFVDTDDVFCMGQDVCLISSEVESQLFLMFQLAGESIGQQLDALVVGATFKRINVDQIRRFAVARPPVIEQTKMAGSLDVAWQRHAECVTAISRQLDLLAEYRSALITAAVTGKLDEDTLRGKKPIEEVMEVPA